MPRIIYHCPHGCVPPCPFDRAGHDVTDIDRSPYFQRVELQLRDFQDRHGALERYTRRLSAAAREYLSADYHYEDLGETRDYADVAEKLREILEDPDAPRFEDGGVSSGSDAPYIPGLSYLDTSDS